MPKLILSVCCLLLVSCQSNARLQSDTSRVKHPPVAFKNMLGVNAFEWDFLQDPKNPNDGSHIYEPKMQLIKSFADVRHYLDWEKIEPEKGSYTFNPTANGGWNLDAIYQRCKADSIDVLVCLKTCPKWLLDTYPANDRDAENVPAPYGSDKQKPASYIDQARAGFQFAARYGYNAKVDRALLTVNSKPRWTGDPVNVVKTGLGLIKYIECDNERDKWWKGDKAHQTAYEYAANLSAFYDGDKGRLGSGVGVKNADPAMQVVMAGLAAPDVKYVEQMIEWCKKNRGYKADGSINLCWDVINFHLYSNDHLSNAGDERKVGIAPELSEAGKVADDFVQLGDKYKLPVWVTEAGYDINDKSPQRAIAIGSKSALITQADWLLRTSLLYARHGIKKVFFYEFKDDNLQSATQYASSGLVTDDLKRRPAAEYISQVKKLLGNYAYNETINNSPLVDIYKFQHKRIYVLYLPTQTDETTTYKLNFKNTKHVIIYRLNPYGDEMQQTKVPVIDNAVDVKITETPVFVEETDK